MQYISLLSAGGWWLSCTEIFGTLEMILHKQQKHKAEHVTCVSMPRGERVTALTSCSRNDGIEFCLSEALHGAVLHGQAVPVQLLTGLNAPTPST